MARTIYLLICLLLNLSFFKCTFFRDETVESEDIGNLTSLKVENNIRWIDILDGAEIYKSPSEDSQILAKISFRNKVKVLNSQTHEEGWEFVEWKNNKGWIAVEDLSVDPPGATNGFVPDYLEDICEGIQNSLECYKAVETKVLMDGVPAKREGTTLSIEVQKDKKMEFKDFPSQGETAEYYNYIDFQQESQIHLIQYSKYEGGYLIGVHGPSGQKIRLIDYPEVSPDGSRFITAFFCPDSNYCENGLQIYKVTAKGFKEEYSLKSQNWTGSDPVWIDDTHVSLFFYDKGFMEEPTQKGTVKIKNGKWVLLKDDI